MTKLVVEVPDALGELALERGTPPEDLARQAVAEWLAQQEEDAEDSRIARERRARIRSDEVRTLSHGEVWPQPAEEPRRGSPQALAEAFRESHADPEDIRELMRLIESPQGVQP